MAQVAPGLEPEHNEPPCYNCGLRGHMFTACPEDPRKMPAGLEASWARRQSSNSPHNDSTVSNKRGKGPVITRYHPPPPPPPPSHHTPPMARFETAPVQPYQSGPVPDYLPPAPYNPALYRDHAPPHPPYDRYGPPGPPGPPVPPVPPGPLGPPPGPHQPFNPQPYNAFYAPPGTTHGPYEYHHGPPPSQPSQYFPSDHPAGLPNRPSPYPPSQYPPGQYPPGPQYGPLPQYPPGPPLPQPPPPNFTHPPAPYGYPGPPHGYSQHEYNPPQRGPSPVHYHQYPPPDSSHDRPYGDNRNRQRGRDHQRRHDDRRSTDNRHAQNTWHNSWDNNSAPNHQTPRDDYRESRHGEGSYRDDRPSRRWGHSRPRDERRQERHDRFHPYKSSDKSDRRHWRRQPSVTTPNRTTARERSPLKLETPTPSKVHQEREPGEIVSEPTSASDHGDLESASSITLDKPIEDYSWDEQTIFMEPPVATRADAIAAPLPSQYTEDVMIPPAFDAKGLKSQYITPRNIDDFAQSIRETRDWQIMQHHPAFLDPTDICLEKLDDYNKIIQMDMAHKNSRRDRLNNSHDVGRHRYSNLRGLGRHPGKNRDSRHKPDRGKRRWNEFHDGVDASRTERRYRDAPYDGSECKRYKPASPEPGEIIESSVQEPPNEFSKAHTVSTEDPKSALEPGELIEDTNMPPQILNNRGISPSRKTKSQQLDVLPPDERNGSNRARSPTPLRQSESPPRPQSRPSSRPSSRGSRGSQPNSRRSSFGSHMTDSQGSPLDSIDRELLGLERPSDSGSESERESPKRQLNPVTPKFKRRQPKVIEAYSRRW